MIKIDWEGLKPPSELIDEWEKLFKLVDTPELDLQWEQFAASAEDNFAGVMESMGFFVRDAEEKGEQYEGALSSMAEAQAAFSAVALSEFIMMEASIKGFVSAIMNTFEQWAIGQIIPKIMAALPFPANLLATGGAILAIKSIFSGIRGEMEAQAEGKAAGGWVGLHGTEIVKVGERGPEWITPNSQIQNITNQGARRIDITIIVQDQLDPYSAQRITRQQIIPQILESLDINQEKKKWQNRLGIE